MLILEQALLGVDQYGANFLCNLLLY